MKKNDRTYNSISNSVYGILSYLIILIITFISRKVFVSSLGNVYLGLNSVFSGFVTMLSLPELGLSTAMLFFLYKPVAENDANKVTAYLKFYKKIYNSIGLIITLIGILFSFTLPFFIHSPLDNKSIQVYFIFYLIGTTITYFYAYKKNILYADQKNRVISISHTLFKTSFEIIQMISIFIFKNYIFYLILMILFNFLENFYCNYYVNKKYKNLINKKNAELNISQKKELFKKVKDLLVQNISGFIVSFTDNLLISMLLNTFVVAIYSNYLLITATLKTLFSQIFSAFTTSFGNLFVTESIEKSYDIYLKAQFLAFWLIGFTSITFFVLIQDFITIWLGERFLFNISLVFIMTTVYYINCINVPSISVQNALGLHYKDKNIMIIQAIVNLVVSYILGIKFGISGIMCGTIIAMIFPVISKPYIIYKSVFQKSFLLYIKQFSYWGVITLIIGSITWGICSWFSLSDHLFLSFIIKSLICCLLPNVLYILLNFKNDYFLYYFNILKGIISKILGRNAVK